MLTLPKLTDRPAQSYVAIRETVSIPYGDRIPAIMDELFSTLESLGVEPSGAVFFKYDIVRMPELVIEFAVPVAVPVAAHGRLVSGTLPPGRYAETTYWGDYGDLMDVNAVLIGWADRTGVAWDVATAADGDHFAARLEIYHNGPDDEPDPAKWQTTVAIKVAD